MAGGGIRRRLLAWFDRSARDLPWRRTRDPYAIWVSEIMLQQTRVDTVVPYYQRFIERFPTPAALAEADEDSVLASWSGLGYYRRARHLHRGVREVVARYGGRVPRDREARLGLPGVGRYTAGAIGSIAFDIPEPVVDGNVARVLSRLRGIDGPAGTARTDRALWEAAAELVRGERPGDLNQALMELGATVCTPAAPGCGGCPVARRCVALREGRVEELPRPRERKAPREVWLAAVEATVGRPPRTWLAKGDGTLFGGLWGLPMVEGRGRAAAREALRSHGIRARLGDRPARRVTHVLSHRRMEVEVWRATAASAPRRPGLRPVRLDDAAPRLGMATLTRKLLGR